MVTYNDFLSALGIIGESDFDNILKSLPENGEYLNEEDLNQTSLDADEMTDINCVVLALADIYINDNFEYAYIEDINFNNKTIELGDVNTLEDLDNIVKAFNNYTIVNYDDLKNTILEEIAESEKEQEDCKKRKLLTSLADKLSLEEIESLVKNYE